MDEAEAVLERLARIEALDREGAPAKTLIDELRALVREAETWSRTEGGEAGKEALLHLRSALAVHVAAGAPADMIAV
ncbi:MAG: hypothetical protein ABI927_05895 [Gaiellaceae bacterium]